MPEPVQFDIGALASLTTPMPMPDLMTWDEWIVDYAIAEDENDVTEGFAAAALDLTKFTWQKRP